MKHKKNKTKHNIEEKNFYYHWIVIGLLFIISSFFLSCSSKYNSVKKSF